MTEDGYEGEIPEGYSFSKLEIMSTNPDIPVSEAEELTLTFTGRAALVTAAADGLLSLLEIMYGGRIVSAEGIDGEPLPLGPEILDLLSLGDPGTE